MANRQLNTDGVNSPNVAGAANARIVDNQFELARSFADATTDAVLLCDLHGQIQYANPTALHESEARFKAMVEHAPLKIYVKDSAGRYLTANPRLLKSWNQSAQDVIGHTVSKLWDAKSAERITREDQEIMRTNKPMIGEKTVMRENGPREIYRIKFPIPGDGDRPIGVASIRYDITERKRALVAVGQKFAG